ncbi:MAG: GNAT family N-acetyltransferase [bacterium]|nr:GNAT family N-acetyltransferase [bacterium]
MAHKKQNNLVIRPILADDSFEDLTGLLHRAYKELADMGLEYLATYQDVETIRNRTEGAVCFVAFLDNRLVGTLTYRSPAAAKGTDWYDRAEVAKVSQMGVEPAFQRTGIASQLLRTAEEQAVADGARELALDTAESANHLIDWYMRLGFRFVDYCDWEVTNYRSVILSKRLSD